ncbi:MAG: Branched-chain phosphotransacylase [Firmicutes bacterium]|nr:Branched-chain phosphotransacylase [Bacillota bacterium]MDI6706349.1 phosphate butyryltransferase [Bacillota bacterium]
MIKNFDDIIRFAAERGPKTLVVAVAQDSEVLAAVKAASDLGIARAVLVGDGDEIRRIAGEENIDISDYEIIDEKDKAAACARAAELVGSGKADMLVKGLVDTSIVLKAVLDERTGLRTGNVLSHVAVSEVKGYDRLFVISDAGMNIAPDLQQKAQIIENAVQVAKALDVDQPKVGIVCAVEKVNPKMPATLDAQELVRMNEEGKIKDCIVGGPFALDNAVSVEAAEHKGIKHPVAGRADVLIVPDIEAGNILYKALTFFARARSSGIVVGAKVPVVVTSRADSHEAKLNSIALGVLIVSK